MTKASSRISSLMGTQESEKAVVTSFDKAIMKEYVFAMWKPWEGSREEVGRQGRLPTADLEVRPRAGQRLLADGAGGGGVGGRAKGASGRGNSTACAGVGVGGEGASWS